MRKPTMEEVKEYFKNAKVVRCQSFKERKRTIDIDTVCESFESFFCRDLFGGTVTLFSQADNKYAEIIEYKEPSYTITKETILKYNMKDEFPEVFEVELKVGEWHYHDAWGKSMFKIESIVGNNVIAYGVNNKGEWKNKQEWFKNDGISHKNIRLATDEEVKECLVNEAKKRGLYSDTKTHYYYKDGSGMLINPSKDIMRFENNTLWLWSIPLFKDGTWATILETISKEEAEKLLNKKIV